MVNITALLYFAATMDKILLRFTGQAKRDFAKKNVDDNDYFVNLKKQLKRFER